MQLKNIIGAMIGIVVLSTTAVASDDKKSASNWLESGWSLIEQHRYEAAIAHWQLGLNTLPDHRLLGSLGYFSEFSNALQRLKMAGKNEKVFIIHDPKESRGYHLLTAQEVLKDIELRQVQLASLKRKTGITGRLLANEARRFKSDKRPSTELQKLEAAKFKQLAEAEAETVKREAEIEAAALKQRALEEAAALKLRMEKQAIAEARKQQLAAEAEAAALKQKAEAKADMIARQRQAEAEAIANALREKAAAEAEARAAGLRAEATAEARAMRQNAELAALKQTSEAEARAAAMRQRAEAVANTIRLKAEAEVAALKQRAEAEVKAMKLKAAADAEAMKSKAAEDAKAMKQRALTEAERLKNAAEQQAREAAAMRKREAELKAAVIRERAAIEAEAAARKQRRDAEQRAALIRKRAASEASAAALKQRRDAEAIAAALQKKAEEDALTIRREAEKSARELQQKAREQAEIEAQVEQQQLAAVSPQPDKAIQQGKTSDEEWLLKGWSHYFGQDYAGALIAWQRGLNELPDDQLLATLGAFSQLGNALRRLQKIGPDHKAIIIRARKNQHDIYYVLSAGQIDADIYLRQQRLASLKKAAGITKMLLAIESKKFKSAPVNESSYANLKLYQKIAPLPKQAETNIWKVIESNSFTINRFEVSGNKLLPTDFILISLRDYYGDERTGSDMKQIRKDVISLYRRSGYSRVKVGLPKQLDDDTVEIQIDENRIRH